MLMPIPRCGARVIPNTEQRIEALQVPPGSEEIIVAAVVWDAVAPA